MQDKSRVTSCWQELQQHCAASGGIHLRELFAEDKERFARFSMEVAGLFLDYSKNRLLPRTMELLLDLAHKSDLAVAIEAMFSGKEINITERRAVLHTALRNPDAKQQVMVDGTNVIPLIHEVLAKMGHCVDSIRKGIWQGHSRKTITDIVNIGIGGSDLGPHMVVEALKPFTDSNLNYHFVSNIDGSNISEVLHLLNPETTLFIVASKTFTTQETLCNAVTAKEWLLSQSAKDNEIIKNHFIAVTAKPERALQFGIAENNIFPFWDWVGGRYSLWGAIGLSIAIALGMDNFQELLRGANAMDEHFRHEEFSRNMPVILALLGILNTNFLGCTTQAIIPYDQYLHLLPAYLQQLDMESNGKRVKIDGSAVSMATAPVLWGAVGTNGQHAFHQLLLQGTQIVPIDFIVPVQTHNPVGEHHLLLVANCLAQSQALMFGKTEVEVIDELRAQGVSATDAAKLAPHKVILGNVPTNTIMLQKVTPFTLGALLALYEHKVFVQGVLWQINSFDQWGVELGKKLATAIVPMLQDDASTAQSDVSTAGLIRYYHAHSKTT